MRRYIGIILLLISLSGYSQTMSVESFKLLETDLDANTPGTSEKDQNGDTAALIKVVTNQTGFTFDGGSLGIVKVKQTPGEVWVYIPRGAKKITIKHPLLGVLRDYYFSCPIEAARTYEMVLVTGEVQTIVKQARTSQYVVFQLVPPDAVVEINGELLKTEGGVASKMMKFGTYNYRVQAPDYLLEAGSVTIDDPDNKKIVNISLKPNFAQVNIKVDNNSEIWINGNKKGEGSWTGNLGAGTYEFEAKKAGHRSTLLTKDIEVTPEPQNISLQTPTPIYGEADINSSPGMADIYIDGEKVGKTPQLLSKLLIGSHHIKISKAGYEDFASTINIKESESVSFNATLSKEPTPTIAINNDTNKDNSGKYSFGFVNTQEIIQAMPEYKRAKSEIDALQQKYESELKSMQDELQKKANAFDIEQATLPDNIKNRRQQELQDLYQKIQQSYQNNQQALQSASQEKMEAITSKVLDAIKTVGQNGNYVIINEINAGIPYISTAFSTDLTSPVMKELHLVSKAEIKTNTKDLANAKLGHIDTQDIIRAMPEYNKAKNEIDKLTSQYEEELKSLKDDLQKKADAFDKEQATLPDNIRQRRQTELQEMYQKIQQSYQDNQQALQNTSSEKMQSITAKVLDAVKAVGQAGDFAIINEIDAGIPYISNKYSTDVTSLVKKKMNLISKADVNTNNKGLADAKIAHINTQEIIQAMPEYSKTIEKDNPEKMKAITAKVLEAIKAVGEVGDFAIIYEINAGIPFISNTLSTDVTTIVKKKLGLK